MAYLPAIGSIAGRVAQQRQTRQAAMELANQYKGPEINKYAKQAEVRYGPNDWRTKRAQNRAREYGIASDIARRQLETYDTESRKHMGELSSAYREANDIATARQLGAVQSGAAQTASRMGLTGGVGAGFRSGVESMYRGASAEREAGFNAQMLDFQMRNRDMVVRGGLDFMKSIYSMGVGANLQSEMAEFQKKLADDAVAEQRWSNFLGSLGGMVGRGLIGKFLDPLGLQNKGGGGGGQDMGAQPAFDYNYTAPNAADALMQIMQY